MKTKFLVVSEESFGGNTRIFNTNAEAQNYVAMSFNKNLKIKQAIPAGTDVFCTSINRGIDIGKYDCSSWWEFSQKSFSSEKIRDELGLTDNNYIKCEEEDQILVINDNVTPTIITFGRKRDLVICSQYESFVCTAVDFVDKIK